MDYITRIRTQSGDKQIDYNSLANLPEIKNIEPIEPLVINGTSYNGSVSVNITEVINTMIDNKLGVIENGSY